MKRNNNNVGILICYYYYGAKNIDPKDNVSTEIEKSIDVVEKTINVLTDLIISEDFNIKKAVNDHFDKAKDIEPNYVFFNSLEKHLQEVVNISNYSIQEIRSRLINNKYKNNVWEELHKSGLTGIQLETKYNYWYSLFINVAEIKQDIRKIKEKLNNAIGSAKTKIENRLKSLYDDLGKGIMILLRVTNKILISLFKVLAFGFVEIIIELKDLIEEFRPDHIEPEPEIIL